MRHPYTEALLRSIPKIENPSHTRLRVITGRPPNLVAPPPGCKFAPRCPYAQPRCEVEEPALEFAGRGGHRFACHYPLGTAENAQALQDNLDRVLPQALARLDSQGYESIDLATVLAATDTKPVDRTDVSDELGLAEVDDTDVAAPQPNGADGSTGPTTG